MYICIYNYVYMYVCMYVCIYVYMYIHICIYLYDITVRLPIIQITGLLVYSPPVYLCFANATFSPLTFGRLQALVTNLTRDMTAASAAITDAQGRGAAGGCGAPPCSTLATTDLVPGIDVTKVAVYSGVLCIMLVAERLRSDLSLVVIVCSYVLCASTRERACARDRTCGSLQ